MDKISIILTIKNEQNNLIALLDSIISQAKNPDEVVIIDGGSNDDSLKILESYIPLFKEKNINFVYDCIPNCNISEGRNIAIQISHGNIIAVTDGGSRLDKNWLEYITKPLIDDKADFVGGFFKPIFFSTFQEALASITTAKRPGKNFLPSSRSVAFTRKLWKDIGGYPEWLDWGEDTLFNKMCLDVGARYIINENAIVYWEVRRNLSQVIKQFYRYALGDGISRQIKLSISITTLYVLIIILFIILNKIYHALLLVLLFPLIFLLRHYKTIKINLILHAILLSYAINLSRFIGYFIGLSKISKKL